MASHNPFVSVIIPTFNGKNKIRKCLKSLEKLDYPNSLIEIIVVDNGSIDGTSKMVGNQFSDVTIVVEPRRGVSLARNTGVIHSKGEIISFLDDDCQVEKNWLRKIVLNFSHKDVMAVGGPVILKLNSVQTNPMLLRAFTRFSNFNVGTARKEVLGFPYLSGANMSFKRIVFDFVSFDPKLGPPKAYLEDFDFCERLLNLGFKILYEPEAIVYHYPEISKLTLPYIMIKRGPKEAFSLYYMNKKHMSQLKILRAFASNCFINTIKFLTQWKGINFFSMTFNFWGILACLRRSSV